MNKEFKVPKRFIVSFQHGYYGKKSSFEISSLLLYSALFLISCLLIFSVLYLALIGPHAHLKSRVERLHTENQLLRDRLDIYSAALDSVALHLNLDLSTLNSQASSEPDLYPYYDPDNEHGEPDSFGYDVLLSTKIASIEQCLGLILNSIQSQDAVAYDATGMNLSINSQGKPSIYPTFGRISDGWGMRIHPIFRRLAFHNGIDFANEIGTPIYATAPGIVTFAGYDNEYGNLIKLSHENSYETRYGHLYNFQVRKGDQVKRGQIIGLMGNSGRSTGPHLHYEVVINGNRVNPSGYLNRLDENIYVRR